MLLFQALALLYIVGQSVLTGTVGTAEQALVGNTCFSIGCFQSVLI